MYENIIAIHNVLKNKITQLNFQPAQYLKNISKYNFEKQITKKKKKEEEVNFEKKKEKKTM